jgi:hypothetical protein
MKKKKNHLTKADRKEADRRSEVMDEFYRIADTLVNQGDTGVLVDLIDYKTQEDFVKAWHEDDDLDQ